MKPEERYQHYYNEGYNAGCVKGYEEAIDKACEWLELQAQFVNINAFRKAMESGSSEFPNYCEKGGLE